MTCPPAARLWTISASGESESSLQLGYKVIGEERFVFVFDFADSRQENLDPELAGVSGRTVTIAYPEDAVSELGEEFDYYAVSRLGGQDVDQCPGDSPLDDRARFPG